VVDLVNTGVGICVWCFFFLFCFVLMWGVFESVRLGDFWFWIVLVCGFWCLLFYSFFML